MKKRIALFTLILLTAIILQLFSFEYDTPNPPFIWWLAMFFYFIAGNILSLILDFHKEKK